MSVTRQFWLFVIPLLVGFSAAGLLVLASVFPEQLFTVGSTGYLATAGVAVVALGILVYRTVVFDGQVGGIVGSERE